MTEPAPTSAPWTTRRLLQWTTAHFRRHSVESPRVVAEMLLAHVIGCERVRLYMEVERPASEAERGRLRELVRRAAAHEPVHYLVGEASFYWRSFRVDGSTLIPQPSTETLVDHVLSWWRAGTGANSDAESDAGSDAQSAASSGTDAAADSDVEPDSARAASPTIPPSPLIADIGTGCGCIAVSLAAHMPGASVLATDIVEAALELARANAAAHGVGDRIECVAGPTLEPLQGHLDRTGILFDVICSNPPYIPHNEHDQMDRAVREHVPPTAWDGGADGLDVVGPILRGAPRLVRPGGLLAVEIATSQRGAALDLAGESGMLEGVEVLKDQAGLWRVVVGRRKLKAES